MPLSLARLSASESSHRNLSSAVFIMAGNDPAVLADQNRIVESELPDAVGDLPDLFLGMDSGVAGMGTKARDGHRFDGRRPDRVGHLRLGSN